MRREHRTPSEPLVPDDLQAPFLPSEYLCVLTHFSASVHSHPVSPSLGNDSQVLDLLVSVLLSILDRRNNGTREGGPSLLIGSRTRTVFFLCRQSRNESTILVSSSTLFLYLPFHSIRDYTKNHGILLPSTRSTDFVSYRAFPVSPSFVAVITQTMETPANLGSPVNSRPLVPIGLLYSPWLAVLIKKGKSRGREKEGK